MTHILTLVAAEQQKLAPKLETLRAALRKAGAATGEVTWLAPNDRACDLPFAHLSAESAHEIARATLTDLPVDFHAQPVSNRRKRLLIVEDNTAEQMSIREVLDHKDIEILTSGIGAGALSTLQDNPCDCVVLDLRLPDMSGFEVLNQLRSD